MFFKELYSVKETADLLNEYFSVKNFTEKDVINMFFRGDIYFAIRCNISSVMGIQIDDDFLSCDISLNGLDDVGQSINLSDGYAEINKLKTDGKSSIIGGGLFNIDREFSSYKRELDVDYILFEQLSFIEYGNVETYPLNIDYDHISLSFACDYFDQIPVNLSSILITQRSVLDCVTVIERRNRNAKFFLDMELKRNQTTSSQSEEKDKYITELEQRIAELENLKKLEEDQPKESSKIDKKAIFIKYLLAVNYGEDVANNPRSNILEYDATQGHKYANGAIQKSFDLKGYKVPVSGRTLENWIKDIKLQKTTE